MTNINDMVELKVVLKHASLMVEDCIRHTCMYSNFINFGEISDENCNVIDNQSIRLDFASIAYTDILSTTCAYELDFMARIFFRVCTGSGGELAECRANDLPFDDIISIHFLDLFVDEPYTMESPRMSSALFNHAKRLTYFESCLPRRVVNLYLQKLESLENRRSFFRDAFHRNLYTHWPNINPLIFNETETSMNSLDCSSNSKNTHKICDVFNMDFNQDGDLPFVEFIQPVILQSSSQIKVIPTWNNYENEFLKMQMKYTSIDCKAIDEKKMSTSLYLNPCSPKYLSGLSDEEKKSFSFMCENAEFVSDELCDRNIEILLSCSVLETIFRSAGVYQNCASVVEEAMSESGPSCFRRSDWVEQDTLFDFVNLGILVEEEFDDQVLLSENQYPKNNASRNPKIKRIPVQFTNSIELSISDFFNRTLIESVLIDPLQLKSPFDTTVKLSGPYGAPIRLEKLIGYLRYAIMKSRFLSPGWNTGQFSIPSSLEIGISLDISNEEITAAFNYILNSRREIRKNHLRDHFKSSNITFDEIDNRFSERKKNRAFEQRCAEYPVPGCEKIVKGRSVDGDSSMNPSPNMVETDDTDKKECSSSKTDHSGHRSLSNLAIALLIFCSLGVGFASILGINLWIGKHLTYGSIPWNILTFAGLFSLVPKLQQQQQQQQQQQNPEFEGLNKNENTNTSQNHTGSQATFNKNRRNRGSLNPTSSILLCDKNVSEDQEITRLDFAEENDEVEDHFEIEHYYMSNHDNSVLCSSMHNINVNKIPSIQVATPFSEVTSSICNNDIVIPLTNDSFVTRTMKSVTRFLKKTIIKPIIDLDLSFSSSGGRALIHGNDLEDGISNSLLQTSVNESLEVVDEDIKNKTSIQFNKLFDINLKSSPYDDNQIKSLETSENQLIYHHGVKLIQLCRSCTEIINETIMIVDPTIALDYDEDDVESINCENGNNFIIKDNENDNKIKYASNNRVTHNSSEFDTNEYCNTLTLLFKWQVLQQCWSLYSNIKEEGAKQQSEGFEILDSKHQIIVSYPPKGCICIQINKDKLNIYFDSNLFVDNLLEMNLSQKPEEKNFVQFFTNQEIRSSSFVQNCSQFIKKIASTVLTSEGNAVQYSNLHDHASPLNGKSNFITNNIDNEAVEVKLSTEDNFRGQTNQQSSSISYKDLLANNPSLLYHSLKDFHLISNHHQHNSSLFDSISSSFPVNSSSGIRVANVNINQGRKGFWNPFIISQHSSKMLDFLSIIPNSASLETSNSIGNNIIFNNTTELSKIKTKVGSLSNQRKLKTVHILNKKPATSILWKTPMARRMKELNSRSNIMDHHPPPGIETSIATSKVHDIAFSAENSKKYLLHISPSTLKISQGLTATDSHQVFHDENNAGQKQINNIKEMTTNTGESCEKGVQLVQSLNDESGTFFYQNGQSSDYPIEKFENLDPINRNWENTYLDDINLINTKNDKRIDSCPPTYFDDSS